MSFHPTIQGELFRGLRPSDGQDVLGWLEANVRIPHGSPRRFDRLTSPHLAEVFEAVLDNSNAVVCCLGAVGTSKTTLLEVSLPYIIAEDPGPTMIVGQTDKEAEIWAETRGQPVLRACPALDPLWPSDRHAKRKMEIMFPHMFVNISGPAISALQSKSIRWGFGDEPWIWPEGRIAEFQGRFHDRWNRRMVLTSQGGTEGTEWHEYWSRTDQRVWGWDCECGDWHQATWDIIRYDEDLAKAEIKDWGLIAASVHYSMPCGRVVENHIANRRALAQSGSYRATNPNPMPRYVGFQWSALAHAKIDPAELVPQWLKANEASADGDPSQLIVFAQKRLAQFAKQYDDADETELVPASYLKSEYANGELIDGELYRFLTCDVGKNHLWGLVRAWRADGSSRLLFEGVVADFDELARKSQQYKIPKPSMVFLDGNYDPERCKAAAAANGWTILRGTRSRKFEHLSKGQKVQRLYSTPMTENVGTSKVTSFHLATDQIKDLLAMHMGGRSAAWEYPADVSDAWRIHMRDEHKVDYRLPSTNQVERRWVSKSRRNHLWDAEVYQIAAALMLRLVRMRGDVEEINK